MIRLFIAFLCAAAACMLVVGALSSSAQTTSTSAPDAYFTQITNSNRPSSTTQVGSFASDISANGRFLVIESNGTYAWLVNIDTGEIIRGNWHRADATQVDHNAVGPAIVLEEALYGKDWVAESLGEVDPNDREQILLQDDARDYAYFFRSKA